MGRKIPGKKHRGIKDPALQKEKRLESIKTKINAPPTNPDEQHVPKSLQKLMDITRKIKDGTISSKIKRKKKKKSKLIKVVAPRQSKYQKKGRPEKTIPKFAQQPGENDREFLYRVNKIVHNVLKESEFEDKYKVDVIRNQKSGEIEGLEKKKKDEIDELMNKSLKESTSKKKKKKKKKDDEVRLTKAEKRKLKLKQRKEKVKGKLNEDDFKNFKDEVKFGDIAHAPPVLTAPRKSLATNTSKVNNNLILKSIFNENRKIKENPVIESNKKDDKIIDKKGKRKNLPAATRRQLEAQREQIVKAYKLIKSKK